MCLQIRAFVVIWLIVAGCATTPANPHSAADTQFWGAAGRFPETENEKADAAACFTSSIRELTPGQKTANNAMLVPGMVLGLVIPGFPTELYENFDWQAHHACLKARGYELTGAPVAPATLEDPLARTGR